ncbi:hypothetical protein ATN00_18295 [Sphingobium baderi]|uniref:Uncharacterized protein n=2 Tax=Sphingomonadaceae TaxID=41297 RepID=A0A0S3F2Z8_9SPHN|nr:hypothetical protein ATN00_18295 [Sphingobium baderi]
MRSAVRSLVEGKMSARQEPKTVKLDVGIWFNEASGHIHVAARGAFISTVSNDPRSKRYHPNLYGKLAACLRDAGASHPSVEGEEQPA